MKKLLVLTAVLAALLLALTACGKTGQTEQRDLQAFWDKLEQEYEMPAMTDATDELLDNYYPGLRDVETKQLLVKAPMMSFAVSEYVFVECADESDAQTVKTILQRRVDEQAAGGAWYPDSVEAWTKARVITHGAYVALIAAAEDTETIASDFSALFE